MGILTFPHQVLTPLVLVASPSWLKGLFPLKNAFWQISQVSSANRIQADSFFFHSDEWSISLSHWFFCPCVSRFMKLDVSKSKLCSQTLERLKRLVFHVFRTLFSPCPKKKSKLLGFKSWLHVATGFIITKRVYIPKLGFVVAFLHVHPALDMPVKTLSWFVS